MNVFYEEEGDFSVERGYFWTSAASVENAALGVSEAVWIERVVLATQMAAPVRPATDGLADVLALLDEVAAEPQTVNERLAEALMPLTGKLPPSLLTNLNDHDRLIGEARDLLLFHRVAG